MHMAGCNLMTLAQMIFSSLFMNHIINNLITSTVWSLQENLKPWPTVLTSLV